MPKEFQSQFGIGEEVSFEPSFRHQKEKLIPAGRRFGSIVAVKFTKSKVFYDVLGDTCGTVFDGLDSASVANMKEEAATWNN